MVWGGIVLAASCAPARTAQPVPEVDAYTADTGADADADAEPEDADADADADAAPIDATIDAGPRYAAQGRCPEGMAEIAPSVCMDRWEASLVIVAQDGTLTPNPPSRTPSDTDDVRAVSRPGVRPQTYVSALQAEDACAAAGKRLCAHAEWIAACEGSRKYAYPYGEQRVVGTCNDDGRSPIAVVFPGALLPAHAPHAAHAAGHPAPARPAAKPAKGTKRGKGTVKKGGKPAPPPPRRGKPQKGRRGTSAPPPTVDPSVWTKLNDPRLGEVNGTFTRTGERAQCKNELDVFDLVGNAHEWVADETASGNGIFAGGYFLDVRINGEGCHYRTTAHARTYRDYSIGFRCCKDLGDDAVASSP